LRANSAKRAIVATVAYIRSLAMLRLPSWTAPPDPGHIAEKRHPYASDVPSPVVPIYVARIFTEHSNRTDGNWLAPIVKSMVISRWLGVKRAVAVGAALLLLACGPPNSPAVGVNVELRTNVGASQSRQPSCPHTSEAPPAECALSDGEAGKQLCRLTTNSLLPNRKDVPCGPLYAAGRFSTAKMPKNSCAVEFEQDESMSLNSCRAYALPDGSRVVELSGSGFRYALHSGFVRSFGARILKPPPLDKSQRVDVGLSCKNDMMGFDLRPGHSSYLGEVRVDTLPMKRLTELSAETSNDWRAVGSLTIHKWTGEEVIGAVQMIGILPNNHVTPVEIWFRLNWQADGDVARLLECDRDRNRNWLTDPLPFD
jgi:hypothetical protein